MSLFDINHAHFIVMTPKIAWIGKQMEKIN